MFFIQLIKETVAHMFQTRLKQRHARHNFKGKSQHHQGVSPQSNSWSTLGKLTNFLCKANPSTESDTPESIAGENGSLLDRRSSMIFTQTRPGNSFTVPDTHDASETVSTQPSTTNFFRGLATYLGFTGSDPVNWKDTSNIKKIQSKVDFLK